MNVSSELSLWLDDFDDIYSDFDSRYYLKRRISDDFLHELRTSIRYKEQSITNLILQLPASKRNKDIEQDIIASLHNFFTEQLYLSKEKYAKVLRRCIIMLVSGMIMMALSFLLNLKFERSLISMFRILFEPAGWFLIWGALDTLYYDFQSVKKEKALYYNLSAMKIHFQTLL